MPQKQIQKITRTFQKAGKWVEKPTRSIILLCSCGAKYIKTRDQQIVCVKCIVKQAKVR